MSVHRLLLLFLPVLAVIALAFSSCAATNEYSPECWTEVDLCRSFQADYAPVKVTGYVSGWPGNNAIMHLHITPNTTYKAANRITQKCPPVRDINIDSSGQFQTENLLPGNYTLSLDRNNFKDIQGFPIPKEGNITQIIWHGGNTNQSMAAFAITSIPINK